MTKDKFNEAKLLRREIRSQKRFIAHLALEGEFGGRMGRHIFIEGPDDDAHTAMENTRRANQKKEDENQLAFERSKLSAMKAKFAAL